MVGSLTSPLLPLLPAQVKKKDGGRVGVVGAAASGIGAESPGLRVGGASALGRMLARPGALRRVGGLRSAWALANGYRGSTPGIFSGTRNSMGNRED